MGKIWARGDRRLAEAWIGFAEKACMMNCFYLEGKNFQTDLTLSEEYENDEGCDGQLKEREKLSV